MLGLPVELLKLVGHFAQLLLKKSQLSQMALHRQTTLGQKRQPGNLFFTIRAPVPDGVGFFEPMVEEEPFDALFRLPHPVDQLMAPSQQRTLSFLLGGWDGNRPDHPFGRIVGQLETVEPRFWNQR